MNSEIKAQSHLKFAAHLLKDSVGMSSKQLFFIAHHLNEGLSRSQILSEKLKSWGFHVNERAASKAWKAKAYHRAQTYYNKALNFYQLLEEKGSYESKIFTIEFRIAKSYAYSRQLGSAISYLEKLTNKTRSLSELAILLNQLSYLQLVSGLLSKSKKSALRMQSHLSYFQKKPFNFKNFKKFFFIANFSQ